MIHSHHSPRRSWIAVAGAILVALSACSAGASPTQGTCAKVDTNNVIAISAKDLKFSVSCMQAPAGTAFKVRFTNNDGIPHDVAIYRDAGFSDAIVKSDPFSGPAVTKDLDVSALPAGTYYFNCIIHPADMKGTLVVK
ncbi:MAG TPA: cupredoxin domain-containing protein [Candidatus Saccharimonadales bacterium]|nr:cupredoxin domain-containing protein [Candidatus Saccharimonadales bacterium]